MPLGDDRLTKSLELLAAPTPANEAASIGSNGFEERNAALGSMLVSRRGIVTPPTSIWVSDTVGIDFVLRLLKGEVLYIS